MADERRPADAYRNSRFDNLDFSGTTFRDCDMRRMRMVDCMLVDVSLSGIIGNLVVNDVDVTTFVEEELARLFPYRLKVRDMRTPDEYQATWDMIEEMWTTELERLDKLPETARTERVDEEWSFLETMRHLIFATDAWAYRTILDEEMPYHRLGLSHTSYPREDARAIGLDLEAQPDWDDVMEIRADRMATLRRIVEGLTEEELARECTRSPGPGYPDGPLAVSECLRVVMEEETEHHRYMLRDLAVLEARY